MSDHEHPVGVDFGGSGIKGAPVDLEEGALAADRSRVATPQPSAPPAVAEVLVELLARFPEATGPVGVTVPGVVLPDAVGGPALGVAALDLDTEIVPARLLNQAGIVGAALYATGG